MRRQGGKVVVGVGVVEVTLRAKEVGLVEVAVMWMPLWVV
jgi:hypothetical protein